MMTVLSRWVTGARFVATVLALLLAHQSGAAEGVISSSRTDVLRWVAVSVATAVIIMGWVLDRSLESTTTRLDRTHKRLIARDEELARLQAANKVLERDAAYWRNAAWGRTVGDETAIQRPDPRFRRFRR